MAATIVLACPVCLQKIRAPESVVGRHVKCPQCKNGFTAVDPATLPAGPVEPAGPSAAGVTSAAPVPVADPLGLDAEEPVAISAAPGGSMMDYLLLRRMITPSIVTGLFYFGVMTILLIGLVYAIMAAIGITSREMPLALGLLSVLLDFVLTLSALIMWRVLCEVILVLFRIYDQLRELNDELRMR